MLRGASAEALAGLTGLATAGTLAETATLGEQLFGVSDLLRRDAALRRALTDNSVEAESRTGLARAVFGSALSKATLDLVADAAGRRWTAGSDLTRATERLGVVATVRSAGANGDTLGDELFAIRRLIDSSPELRNALSDQTRSVQDRTALMSGLLKSKVLPATGVLVSQAVSRGRGSVDAALQEFLDIAAEALAEIVATVHTAQELTAAEQERLSTALTTQYGTKVQLHMVLDPSLIGGVRVEIGDDVIDGTVASRLDDAQRKLAG